MISSLHSYLTLAYAGSAKAAKDVGFYYAANAGGRLMGILLSGALTQLGGLSVANVNIPVTLMIVPMLLRLDFGAIATVTRHWRGMVMTLVINWLIKPFSKALLGWLFIRVLFRPYLPVDQIDRCIAGLILLAASPCTAMVFVWSNLSGGDPNFTLSRVALNDAIMIVAFAPIVGLLLGLSVITVPWDTLFLSVVRYIVIPPACRFLIHVNAPCPGPRNNAAMSVQPDRRARVMTRNMGRRFALGTTIAALAGVAAVAVAQPATGPGRGPGGGPGYGMMGGGPGGGPGMMGGGPGMMGGGGGMMGGSWTTGSYLDSLKSQLKITANQEPAWKEYADIVSGVGQQMQALHQSLFDSMGTASWQERRDMMNRMFQARQQSFDTVHEAADKLVAALDPAQKATAQQYLPGLAYGHGMMGRR